MTSDVSYFARTNFHNVSVPFGIKQADRRMHMYCIGQTGVGKSTLIETLAIGDVLAGRGFALLDPHGDLVDRVWRRVPEADRPRVRYLNAPDPVQPYGYNPLRRVRADKIPMAVSGVLETLKKLWPDAWGVRMEHMLRNSLFALLEHDDMRLPDILRLYSDKHFRKAVTQNLQNEVVRNFWRREFENYHYRQRADAVAPVQNKLGALLADPTLYRILVEPAEPLSFRTMMDRGEILLVNLSKGRLGEDSSHLLGGLIVSTLGLAAFSRAEASENERRPFALFLDEFQSFTTLMLVNMAAELRKSGISLVLAHQHLHQLEPDIQHAVLGNTSTVISFRLGPEDASTLVREFYPQFGFEDLIALPNHRIYLKLMIDGSPSAPFSANTLSLDKIGDNASTRFAGA